MNARPRLFVPAVAVLAALLLAACGQEVPDRFQGYVEGEFIYVAPPYGGRLQSLHAARGQVLRPGDLLFRLESEEEEAALARAEQQLAANEATLADMGTGKRPDELDVLRAQLAQAQAAEKRSGRQRLRDEAQFKAGGISRAQLDESRTTHTRDRALVDELTAQLAVGHLPARPEQIAAQTAVVAGGRAAVREARWKLAQQTGIVPVTSVGVLPPAGSAPAPSVSSASPAPSSSAPFAPAQLPVPQGAVPTGSSPTPLEPPSALPSPTARAWPQHVLVVDTLYRQGEWVSPGSPVVKLLDPALVKVRFFVPEAALSQVFVGQAVQIRIDGRTEPVPGVISYINAEAEYTPPVIYSNETRAKLVFMVEARPTDTTAGSGASPGSPPATPASGPAAPAASGAVSPVPSAASPAFGLHPGQPVEVRLP